jgi:hypothetical protein
VKIKPAAAYRSVTESIWRKKSNQLAPQYRIVMAAKWRQLAIQRRIKRRAGGEMAAVGING